ncbi:LysR family transcriptional regulator [uncultured Adlercreutzia sp.]|uniref:LysR family transcriptional regulator n=1 Tax=uncultured Adlercreutzia sp. TaxID=875803 RepID=UPI0025F8F48D|nr:LysR family transcriptional regulator [uncultured Adlercreutzia sp.]MCI9261094.1 LysR family transcriptional regulator [Eggerthellaceae bacterium]
MVTWSDQGIIQRGISWEGILMLETSQMQRLVAVAECGTITEAAERLYLTQPALSRALKRMEDDLGVQLFDRSRKNDFHLTETGWRAADMARDILKRTADMENRLRAEGATHAVTTVGACTPPALWGMLPVLANEFPEIIFSSTIVPTTLLKKGIEAGDLQVAFMAEPLQGEHLTCYKWVVEQLFAVFPASHPLHDADEVTLEELGSQSFLIQDHVGDWLDIVRREAPNLRLLVQEDRATLLGLARSSELPRFMSNMTMSFDNLLPGERAVPVRGAGSQLQLWCVHTSDLAAEIAQYLALHARSDATGA